MGGECEVALGREKKDEDEDEDDKDESELIGGWEKPILLWIDRDKERIKVILAVVCLLG